MQLSENASGTATITGATLDVVGLACSPAPADNVQFLTARATGGHVKLEWQNPAANFGSTKVCWSTAAYPTDPTACSALTVDVMGGAGEYGTAGHDTGNGTPVYYAAFVNNGSGTYSSGKRVKATPFATSGAAKWAYSTGASSLAPPGLEWGGAYYAVSNDRALHAMNGAAAGGDWPRTSPDDWLPRSMDAPVQHQPPVVPLGATTYVYLASQDGYAYAFDARSGTRLWTSNDGTNPLQLGTMLQADPVGLFAYYGATDVNRLFVGTRNGSGENLVHALDPATGTVVYTYGVGQGIGIITGMSADYANRRVYFASRALSGGSSNTLWCLDVTSTGANLHRAWALGDIDGTPVAYGGRVYVGDNAGEVTCVDPESNTLAWTYATGDGPVKGYVYPDFATPLRLYFSTSTKVHALEANGAAVTSPAGWPVTTIAAPTTPQLLFDSGHLLTGSSNGSLYQVSLSNPASVTSVPLGSGQLGAVAVDTSDPANVIAIVGSTAGVVYAVRVPL